MKHLVSGEPLAAVSQANRGLIARDLGKTAEHQRLLGQLSTTQLSMVRLPPLSPSVSKIVPWKA